ncbi:MAG: hybrid sensor histidine kinase/response regulator transcription factor [Ktedonobacteraceae bacterium]
MVTSDMLLHLIADLQGDMTATHGRRTLLKYAQTTSGARLALLFVFHKEHQTLVLVERYGQRPQRLQQEPHTSSISTKKERFNTKRISAQGLFGSALHRQGFLHVLHAYNDPRILKEEQYWIGLDDDVILSAIGQQQGVLVLCFDPVDKTQPTYSTRAITDEGNLLVCTTLLSAYLSTNDKRVLPKGGDNAASLRNRAPGLPASNSTSFLPLENVGEPCLGDRYTLAVARQQELYEIKLKVAIDEERSRIARDIHDGVAQNIVHAIHKLEFIQRVLEKQPDVALQEISRTSDLLKESWHDLRQGISSLIPLQLEEQGFDAALQNLLHEHMHDEPTLKIDYERDDFARLPLSLEVPIFRFIQEALNNVRKHAQASRVVIRIRLLADILLVEVSDNGEGFDVEEVLSTAKAGPVHHMGLRAMRDRVQEAGGQWEISSKSDEGTTIRARFLLATSSGVLTQREREVLRLLVEGLTNRAIAEKLSVSTETIKSHVHHIMQKMQVNDRTRAAVIATKQHWL